MGTCYRLVDHKRKLYYDLNKWYAMDVQAVEAATSFEALASALSAHSDETWYAESAKQIAEKVTEYMELPVVVNADTSDWDVAEEGYVECGGRFTVGNGFHHPYEGVPQWANTYVVCQECPGNHSTKFELCKWDGSHWLDKKGLPLALHTPFYWALREKCSDYVLRTLDPAASA